GADDDPYPRWSGATTCQPAAASGANWWRQEYQHSGNPCSSRISGPPAGPASATWNECPVAPPGEWRPPGPPPGATWGYESFLRRTIIVKPVLQATAPEVGFVHSVSVT